MFTINDLHGSGQRKYILPEERLRLLHTSTQLPIEQQLFLQTLIYTGCRISEALELTTESIDHKAGYLIFRTLKQKGLSRFRAVPVPEEFLTSLQELQNHNGHRIWSVRRTQAWMWVKSALASACVSGMAASPKGLRHGFGVACVEAGIPLTLIQKWMGHADIRTTAIYLNVSGAEERRQAMKLWEGLR